MRRLSVAIPICLTLVTLVSARADGQSVADVVDQMYAAYERQADGVDDYTLVQHAMGFEAVSYFEKEMIEGKPVFKLKNAGMEGFAFGLGDEDAGQGDIFLIGPGLVEHGRYAGREEIDGSAVHVLALDDASQLDLAKPAGPEGMEFEPKTIRLYVDADLLVPRRIEFVGDATMEDGSVHEVTMRLNMEDLREVQGLVIPYRTRIQIQGLPISMDPGLQAQLEELESQLDNMPPAQRQAVEQVITQQREQFRQMTGGDGMTVEVTVADVRVNTGPPNG